MRKKEDVTKKDMEIAKEMFVYLLKNGKIKIPHGAPLKGKTEEERKIFFLEEIRRALCLGKLSHSGKIARDVHFFSNGHITYDDVENFIRSVQSRFSCRMATE